MPPALYPLFHLFYANYSTCPTPAILLALRQLFHLHYASYSACPTPATLPALHTSYSICPTLTTLPALRQLSALHLLFQLPSIYYFTCPTPAILPALKIANKIQISRKLIISLRNHSEAPVSRFRFASARRKNPVANRKRQNPREAKTLSRQPSSLSQY